MSELDLAKKWNIEAKLWNVLADLKVVDSYMPYCNEPKYEEEDND